MTAFARGALALALVVVAACDGGSSPSATPPPVDHAPIAWAGDDFTVLRGERAYLYGSGLDPDGRPVTYHWEQLAGIPVALAGASSANASFTAPVAPGDLTFSLTVSDGSKSASDQVVVHVGNRPPLVWGATINPVGPRTADDLTAAAQASDGDGDVLTWTYAWRRNGAILDGEVAATLPAALTTKGDVFVVTVTVSDGIDSASTDATTTIQDTPPVLTISPPAEVAWGATYGFQIEAYDADGDAVTGYHVDHGPAGMTVSASGYVSWPAFPPMFDRALDVHWGVGVAGVTVAPLTGSVRVVDGARVYALRRTGFEIPVYEDGLQAGDLDGDGDQELLVASHTALYELAWTGAGYAQAWMYPFAIADAATAGVGNAIGGAVAGDVDGDGRAELFVAAGNAVVALDGLERREAARHDSLGAWSCGDLELADLSGDGSLEVICLAIASSSTASVVVLDAATLQVLGQSPVGGLGNSLAVGNVDADAGMEIVTAGGYVFHGPTLANEWAAPAAFGAEVDTGDVDGDGVEEIVGIADWGWVRGYDARSKALAWEITSTSTYWDLDALLVADIDADGRAEVVTGDGQWGFVTSWSWAGVGKPFTKDWAIDSQDHGVTSIARGDLDADGKVEIAWGTGASSSGEDRLVVAGKNPSIGVEWMNGNPAELDPPFVGGRLARLGGGERALVYAVAETDNGYAGTRIVGLDPGTGRLRLSAEVASVFAASVVALDVADPDGDGVDEVIYSANGNVVSLDLASGAVEWSSPPGSGWARALTTADVTGDGRPEAIAITSDGIVQVWDVWGQRLVWGGPALGYYGTGVEVADLDGDGTAEIVALTIDEAVVYERVPASESYQVRASVALAVARDLAVGDCDGDLAPEVYVLTGNPYLTPSVIVRLDGALVELGQVAVGVNARSLFVEPPGPGRRNLVVGVEDNDYPPVETTQLRALDAVSGLEIWRSPGLAGAVQADSLAWVDLAGDGHPELSFGTSGGMYVTR